MKYIKEGTEFLDQLKDSVHDLYDEKKELQQRIDKAIEYIDFIRNSMCISEDYVLTNILEILRGE